MVVRTAVNTIGRVQTPRDSVYNRTTWVANSVPRGLNACPEPYITAAPRVRKANARMPVPT
jgi:hypothetical protein